MTPEELLSVKLLNHVRGWLEGRRYDQAMRALNFARKRHIGTRKDKVTPEFSHQLHITRFFMNLADLLKNPERVIVLVLLHDTVEDEFASLSDIEQQFGNDIADAVRLLSKKINGYKLPTEIYYNNMLQDVDVCLVKGGDRLHNLETIKVFSPQKKHEYALETAQYVLPLLKEARNLFPEHSNVINNTRQMLNICVNFINAELEALTHE